MGTEKMSYEEFLRRHNANQAKIKELRDQPNFQISPFVLRLRTLRLSEHPRWTRLIPYSKKKAWWSFYQAWLEVSGKKRPVLCNCERGALALPCLPCHKASQKEDPKMLPSQRDAITALVLEHFHKITRTSKAGKEFSVYEPCMGTDVRGRSVCEHCDNDIDKIYTNKYYWPMGYKHKLQLEKQLDEIKGKCENCKNGTIEPYAYACEKCGSVIFSHEEHDLSREDEKVLREADDVACPECGHTGKVQELIECLVTEGYGSTMTVEKGCDNPTPIEDIWSLDFALKTVGESGQSSVVIADWRVGDNTDLKDWQLEPMDFPYFLQYMDLDEQAKAMGCENPFSEELQQVLEDHYKGTNDEDEDEVEEY